MRIAAQWSLKGLGCRLESQPFNSSFPSIILVNVKRQLWASRTFRKLRKKIKFFIIRQKTEAMQKIPQYCWELLLKENNVFVKHINCSLSLGVPISIPIKSKYLSVFCSRKKWTLHTLGDILIKIISWKN